MAEPDIQPAPGILLIAPPMLLDANFRRTVVLLCEHGPEGSFGLILNRPLALQLNEVMAGLDQYPDALSLGGPVQPNTLHFLHRYGERVPDAIPVLQEVFWGGDFDMLKDLMQQESTGAHTLRFFLGYAGWSPGQLEIEIEQGGWILDESQHHGIIFSDEPDKLWRHVLRRKGGEYAILANFPDDPRMN